MFEERLLERIARLEIHDAEKTQNTLSRELVSIVKHLQKMLNTRQGSVEIADDYGVPDMTNFPSQSISDTEGELSKIIREVILKYEPRLSNVKVSFEPGDENIFSLRFKLEARLTRDKKTPITLETVINSSGKINVVT